MGTLASGSIDLNSLKIAGEPNKYITYIDSNNGIRIYDAKNNGDYVNFTQINSNGLQIYKGGTSDNNKIANFGTSITLGNAEADNNKFNILITNTAVSSKGPGILLRQGTNVLNEISVEGMNLYDSNANHLLSITPNKLEYIPLSSTDTTFFFKRNDESKYYLQNSLGFYSLIQNYNMITTNNSYTFSNLSSLSSGTPIIIATTTYYKLTNFGTSNWTPSGISYLIFNKNTSKTAILFSTNDASISVTYNGDTTFSFTLTNGSTTLVGYGPHVLTDSLLSAPSYGHIGRDQTAGIDKLRGNHSFSMNNAIARGTYSCAINSGEAFGDYSFAAGISTAVGYGSAAFGVSNISYGSYSFVAGHDSEVFKHYGVAIGRGLKSINYDQTVFGKYNELDTDAILIIGNGTADNARSNLMTVGDSLIRIGNNSQSYITLDYHSLQMVDKEGNSYFYVSDLRNLDGTMTDNFVGDGNQTVFELSTVIKTASTVTVTIDGVSISGFTYTLGYGETPGKITFNTAPTNEANISVIYTPADSSTFLPFAPKAYTMGTRKDGRIGVFSVAEGNKNIASGVISHAEGNQTIASGRSSHAEGEYTEASNAFAHAEGYSSIADNRATHAEGWGTQATGDYGSHSEGRETKANGQNGSHAEGYGSVATGWAAHAEGAQTLASAYAAHAQNYRTVATTNYQTVIGKYNVATRSGSGTNADPYVYTDTGNFALVIGNGSDDDTNSRSNALTVDWNGNINQAGRSTTSDMTSSEIQDFVDDLQAVGNGIVVDYIVDQGTSGIWTYRKWASGVSECWGTQPSTSYAMTKTYGNGYYIEASRINYPSNLFIDPPVWHASKGYAAAGLEWISVAGNSASAIDMYVCDTISHTASFPIVISARGKWK